MSKECSDLPLNSFEVRSDIKLKTDENYLYTKEQVQLESEPTFNKSDIELQAEGIDFKDDITSIVHLINPIGRNSMDLDVCMNENNTNSPDISIPLDKSSVSEENLCDIEIDCKDGASFNITMMDSEDKNNTDDEVCINGNNSTKFNTSDEQSFVSESSNLCADKIDKDDSSSMILSVSTDKKICINQDNCITESNTTLSNVSSTQERSLVSESINLCNNKQFSKEKCEDEEKKDTKTIELPINRNNDISSNKEDRPNAILPDNICSEKILEEIGQVIDDVKSIEPPNLTQTSENISENNRNTNLTNVDGITIIKSEHLSEDVFENFSVKLENFQVEEETIIDVSVANDSGELNNDLTNICNDEEVENKDDNDTIIECYSLNYDLDEVKNDSDDAIFIEDCKLGSSDKNDKSFIKEGSAEILLQSKNVFYNPVQEFNRDLSVAALTVFAEEHQTDPRYKNRGVKRKNNSETESTTYNNEENNEKPLVTPGVKTENGITILEALSATGLRSIRYAKEIAGVKQVIANDISEIAVQNIEKNAEHNGVGNIIVTSKSDAALLMYQNIAKEELYDVIDLDPYGCPSRFLDAAVQAVRDGGILLVTCTDMAVLAGNSPETCHAKYGSISLRNSACHEMALRIALQCIESHANRYGRYIVPLLSFSADFYIRVIVQVYTSPVTCKKTTSKLSMVYKCVGCESLTLNPLGLATQVGNNTQMKFTLPHSPPVNICCAHCFYEHVVGGPIWSAPIHKQNFVERMLKVAETQQFGTSKRMEGMLEVIREELPDVPLYYTISGLCSKIHCTVIPLTTFRSALLNAGYRVSLSHAAPNSVKTNAPVKTLWDIIRCWVQMNPISQRRLSEGSVSAAILFQEPTLNANFEFHPKAHSSSRIRGLLRFQQNPIKNWGPGTRSRANVGDNLDERRIAKQNKKSKKTNVEIIEVITIPNDEDEIKP